jgi:hypothetical protein
MDGRQCGATTRPTPDLEGLQGGGPGGVGGLHAEAEPVRLDGPGGLAPRRAGPIRGFRPLIGMLGRNAGPSRTTGASPVERTLFSVSLSFGPPEQPYIQTMGPLACTSTQCLEAGCTSCSVAASYVNCPGQKPRAVLGGQAPCAPTQKRHTKPIHD